MTTEATTMTVAEELRQRASQPPQPLPPGIELARVPRWWTEACEEFNSGPTPAPEDNP